MKFTIEKGQPREILRITADGRMFDGEGREITPEMLEKALGTLRELFGEKEYPKLYNGRDACREMTDEEKKEFDSVEPGGVFTYNAESDN